MKSVIKSKRGNVILDVLVLIVILFILALSWVTIGYIGCEFNDDIQLDPDLPAEAKQINQDLTTQYSSIFDGAILFFLIIFWGLTMVASFMIDTHPVFFVFSLILLILVLTVSVALGNIFYEIFTEDITGQSANFPLTFWIMNNFLIVTIVLGASVLFALFARPQY